MKNIFEIAFLKLDKYLSDDVAYILITIVLGILLSKVVIALI